MPNHVSNILTINAGPQQVEKVLAAIRNEQQAIDFNKIIPMPESLNCESGSNGEHAVEYILAKLKESKTAGDRDKIRKFETRFGQPEQRERAVELGLTYIKNIVLYGYETWYEWCNANWGTKWNAYDVVHSEGSCVIEFDTAWNAPIPVIEALSNMFPDTEFHLVYADEDASYNTGDIEFLNGITSCFQPEGGSDKAYELYLRTHEWAKDELIKDEQTGEWHWKDDL